MDDERFDAWTRRAFGMTAAGLASAILGLTAIADVGAKKKMKRCGKKCIKGTCCPGKACGENCECGRTVEGTSFCFAKLIAPCEQCNSSAECDEGFQCVQAICGDVTAEACSFDPPRS